MKKFKESVVRALLPQIILSEAAKKPVHGYGLIAYIRKVYGVYLGPSTMYPSLNVLERDGLIRSEWTLWNDRPRRVYTLTARGKQLLGQTTKELAYISNTLIEAEKTVRESV